MKIKKIYFDMDGVLADFSRGVLELGSFRATNQMTATKEQDEALWAAVRGVKHFYDRLEPMPGAVEMFRAIYEKYGDRVEILTGIPKPKRRIVTAGEDKTSWAHRVLSDNLKVNIVFKEEKKNFCTGLDCVLIDDLATNIEAWHNIGGTGILFHSAEKTLEELRKLEME